MADMVRVSRPNVNQFAEEPQVRIGRSQFDRSHGLKTAFDASYLYPILVDEVLPGDTFTCRLNGFCRIFSPLDAPVMDNIELETFFFFVPNRLLWDNWAYFMGEHDVKGAQDTDYTIPILTSASAVSHNSGSYTWAYLAAYMGLPDGLVPNSTEVSALPFRAYNLCYNTWFRDENLVDTVSTLTNDGPDAPSSYFAIRKSAKKHDYFTSALPYLQKGDPVSVALAGTAYIHAPGDIGDYISIYSDTDGADRQLDTAAAQVDISATAGTQGTQGLYADLTAATGVSINALRESVAIQRLLERDARGGTRYTELIKSHFGVTNPDFRLQRPEYLGGGKSFINISPVANTSATATEDQGELKGLGTGVINGHGWAKSFTEHGYILGLVRARGDITYFQGLDKLWSRSTRYDFYIPALANLGEQSVLNKELFVTNTPATDDATFGYQERWAEYRHKPSRITGVFNPDATSALSFWHLAEDFSTTPTLNQTFIEDATPMARVTTVDTASDFLLDVWFNYKCARPIPVHSIPSLIGSNF
mgnify:CR=1 FL=1